VNDTAGPSWINEIMEEVIARGGRVIAICSEGDHEVRDKVEMALEIPTDGEEVSPSCPSRCSFWPTISRY
jgi:glucosamine 6-phosphate synthetase-like amidotransferase/phosphosugar isomerase protein